MKLRSLVLFFLVTLVSSTYLDANTKKACDNVFSNKAMSVSCCDPMNEFVSKIQKCHKKLGTQELTCAVANCITRDQYHISSNGKINITSCYILLNRLDRDQPLTTDMNELIREECVANEGYRRYVTYDPSCEVMQYLSCAFVSYLRKCQKFNKSPAMCQQLAKDVKTCDPKCDKYLNIITSKNCK